MQHYGAPTRVLDWTGSPFVASYFAVEKDPDSSGEVWAYSEEALEALWVDAKNAKKLDCWPVEMKYCDYVKVRRIDGTPILHHFIHAVQTSRMAAQQGVFTVSTDVLSDHGVLLREILGAKRDRTAYQRVLIPAKCKLEFLSRLRFMNITRASLFPGIDGVGRSVDEWGSLKLSGHR